MTAMKNIREYVTANDIDAEKFSIQATVMLQKAFTKGGFDVYEPEVTKIQLSNGPITYFIEPSSAFDEIARATHEYGHIPFQTRFEPKGSSFSFPVEQVVLPLGLTMQRVEAAWELNDAMHDDTPGNEQRFDDARWKVFYLTDEFAKKPCTRAEFDKLSIEKEELNIGGSFREFYNDCIDADETAVVNGEIKTSIRVLVEKTAESFLELDETGEEVKTAVYGSFKVHPRHRALFDAIVDERIATRKSTFTL